MPARHLAHDGTTMQASNPTVGPVVLTPRETACFDRLRAGRPVVQPVTSAANPMPPRPASNSLPATFLKPVLFDRIDPFGRRR